MSAIQKEKQKYRYTPFGWIEDNEPMPKTTNKKKPAFKELLNNFNTDLHSIDHLDAAIYAELMNEFKNIPDWIDDKDDTMTNGPVTNCRSTSIISLTNMPSLIATAGKKTKMHMKTNLN